MTRRLTNGQRRPWCLPCRELTGDIAYAGHDGVVCEWHWGILSDADKVILRDAVLERRPRGGKVRTVLEQIWVLRVNVRQGLPNTIRQTWEADAEAVTTDAAQ